MAIVFHNQYQHGFTFKDREAAGSLLAGKVKAMHSKNAIVLAIPRGGVIIGYKVAEFIRAELDIITPRKLRDPYEPELAIGAVMPDGSTFLNDEVIAIRSVTKTYIDEERQRQMAEANRRMASYRGGREYPRITGREVIIVDDGIATGATVVAAARWVRKENASSVTIASPIIPKEMLDMLKGEADKVLYLAAPEFFYGVGQFYAEFGQVDDSKVIRLLSGYWHRQH